jgi:hypothetical protein
MAVTQQSPTGPQLMFYALLTATVNDVTGDATDYTIIYDSAPINVGTCYNTATGVFTVPATGSYMFQAGIFIYGMDVAHTLAVHRLVNTTSTWESWYFQNAGYSISPAGMVLGGSGFDRATKGDQIVNRVTVNNGTKVVDIGGAATGWTWWACYKVT